MTKGFVLLWVALISHTSLCGQENFEALYNELKAKIEREEPEPGYHDNSNIEAIIKWMEIKAADRDNARAISLRANQAGNPYWEQKFINLALDAQHSGELTIWRGVLKLMRGSWQGRREIWVHCVHVCGPQVGQALYKNAVKNGFSTEDIVERARCLMRWATNDLEANRLYTNYEGFAGYYDSEGFQVMPKGDWYADCLRRGEYTTTSQGKPLVPADKAMEWVDQVREICEFYHFNHEFDDATDLMVQYLKEKEVLCLLPSTKGHQWFIELAQQYKLDEAKEHMEGFYATIKGKVEKEKNGGRKPVAGAEVEFEAPKDQRVWTAKTDNDGYYKIEGVILHKNCGPFILTARGDGCFELKDIPGPLEEPDKSLELEQNLLLECGVEGYSGSIAVTKTWDYTNNDGNSSTKYIGKQTVTFTGTFKSIPQMEGMEGQPIKIYGPDKVSGTWSHNEDRYCSGDCDCPGLIYQEFGTGEFPYKTLKEGLIIITNVFPTDIKDVADQLGQFGLVNWYDVATPTENVPIQTRYRHYIEEVGCVWGNSTSSTNLTGTDVRFKLKDINHLSGSVSWSSSMGTTGISATDMTEAIYEQKPFEPEQDGTDYHYAITWNLQAL